MLIIKLLLGITLIASISWFIASPSYQSGLATLTSLIALITAFLRKNNKQKMNQQQNVSENSIGIQAGSDVSIGSINTSEKTKDDE